MNVERKKNTGFIRLFKAIGYSWSGLKAAFVHEAAFRQELLLAVVLLPLAVLLDVTLMERLLMASTVFMVLIVELLNSATETVVDRFGPEQHELAGRAKDLASAAVFLSLILCGIVWVSIIYARYFSLT